MTRRDFITKGAMATAGAAIAANVRSNLGGMHSRYIPNVPQGEYTAADYVQDGLIAQWDGIENIGFGEHDGNTTIWTDLARQNPTEWFDVSGAIGWTGDSLVLNSSLLVGYGYLHNYLGSYFTDVDFDLATFEYCFSCDNVEAKSGAMITLAYITGGPFALVTPWNFPRIIGNGNGQYGQYPRDAFSLVPYIGGQLYGTFSYSPLGLSFRGDMETPLYLWNKSKDFRYGFYIGALGGNETRLHSVRVYSRTLDQSEVKYNFKVDQARFGL